MSGIYIVGPESNILFGPVERIQVPGVGFQMPENGVDLGEKLADAAEGHVWVLADGTAVQLADHRGPVYLTATGEELEHTELDALPEGLTTKPWPGAFYVWQENDWVLSESARLQAALLAERVWRNAQISSCDFLAMPDYPLSSDRRIELYAYRQALRDWPSVTHFPDLANRPQPPQWFAELSS